MHPHTNFGIPTSKNIGDTHRTGRTDGRTEEWTKQILYASHSSFWGIKTVLLKKAELIIAANPVCKFSTSLYKA